MRGIRNAAFAVLVLLVLIGYRTAVRADIECGPYNYLGEPGCYCTCSAPDSCGGPEGDCSIAGFDGVACEFCYPNQNMSLKETNYCFDHEADFVCQKAMNR